MAERLCEFESHLGHLKTQSVDEYQLVAFFCVFMVRGEGFGCVDIPIDVWERRPPAVEIFRGPFLDGGDADLPRQPWERQYRVDVKNQLKC